MTKTKKPQQTPFDGLKAVTEMFAYMDPEHRAKLLANVTEKDPQLAEKIQERLFVFDDLKKLSPSQMQLLIKKFPQPKWALALRAASDEMKEFIFKNMSERAAQALREDVEALGPQKVSEVKKAQAEIAETAKRILASELGIV